MTFGKPITIGRCIYCASTTSLAREHVVPSGLNGNWVLKDASCKTCAAITSELERVVLRDMFGQARAFLQFRTRRPDQRPQTFTAEKIVGNARQVIDLPLADHPVVLAMPEFFPPEHVTGAVYEWPGGNRTSAVVLNSLDGIQRHTQPGESISITAIIAPQVFRRFLAKVGYGFAVASEGLDAVSGSPVIPNILCQEETDMRWVGCMPGPGVVPNTALHGSDVRDTSFGLMARIRLFARYNAPEYAIIITPREPRARAMSDSSAARTSRPLADEPLA